MKSPVNNNLRPLTGRPSQLDMFIDVPRDPVPFIKNAMASSIKKCDLSREQIVDAMNEQLQLAGITTNGRSQRVTPDILDAWCALSKTNHVIPLKVLPFFCRAVNSTLALEAYSLAFTGVAVISEERSKVLAWAEAEIELKRARTRARKLGEEVLP